MKFEKSKITLSLSLPVEQVNTLSGLTVLMNAYDAKRGDDRCFSETEVLKFVVESVLERNLKKGLEDMFSLYSWEKSQSERDGEAGDVPARNPAPEAASDEAGPEEPGADGEEEESVEFTFSVTEGDMIHNALCSVHQNRLARRFPRTWLFPVDDEAALNLSAVWEGDTPMTLTAEECETISNALYARAMEWADKGYETIADEHFNLARRVGGADGATSDKEPETASNAEEVSASASADAEAAPEEPDADGEEEEPETLFNEEETPRNFWDDDGFVLVSNRYGEPDLELMSNIPADLLKADIPEETVIVADGNGGFELKTVDEVEAMREAAQGIYNGKPPEPDFEPDAPEREPETLIPIIDADGVRRMATLDEVEEMREAAQGIYEGKPPEPQMEDMSDGYVYYLEHGHWPPDDEVLAGPDVPCTGDYGLSDCLVLTQSSLDFVDAFFS